MCRCSHARSGFLSTKTRAGIVNNIVRLYDVCAKFHRQNRSVDVNLFTPFCYIQRNIKTTFIRCSSREFIYGRKCLCNRNVPT